MANIGSRGVIKVEEDFLGFRTATMGTTALPVGSNGVMYVSANEGSFAINTSGDGGVLKIVTDTADHDNCFLYVGPFRPQGGGCEMETRIRPIDILTCGMYAGFAEILDATTPVFPVSISGTTAVYTDVTGGTIGVMHDSDATTADWRAVVGDQGAVHADADTNGTRAYEAPVNAQWDVIRCEIGVSGRSNIYLNGRLIKTVAEAVTPTNRMYAVVGIETRISDDSGKAFEIDYFDAYGNRDWAITV